MKPSLLKTTKKIYQPKIFKLLSLLCICLVATTSFSQERYRGIAVYIDFSDLPKPEDVTHERMEALLNSMDYSEETIAQSVCKYWYEQSRGQVIIEHDIFYYRAPKPSSYYAKLDYKEGVKLWHDALESAVANNPDYAWDKLSTDENGKLRSVMIYNSDNFVRWIGATHHGGWTLANGVQIKSLYGSYLIRNGEPSLFTPIHESGHAFFKFPDTYDNGYDSGGTGAYTVMSGGRNSIIEPVGAPFKVQSNWGNIIEVEHKPGIQTMTIEADGNDVIVFRNPADDKEFYALEARKKSNVGNNSFPVDLGLLLWHTDLNVKTFNKEQAMTPEKHYKHAIVQADGLFELEKGPAKPTNIGNEGDIYIPGRTFSNTTVPNSKWWNGDASNLEIKNIQFVDENHIQFDVVFP